MKKAKIVFYMVITVIFTVPAFAQQIGAFETVAQLDFESLSVSREDLYNMELTFENNGSEVSFSVAEIVETLEIAKRLIGPSVFYNRLYKQAFMEELTGKKLDPLLIDGIIKQIKIDDADYDKLKNLLEKLKQIKEAK